LELYFESPFPDVSRSHNPGIGALFQVEMKLKIVTDIQMTVPFPAFVDIFDETAEMDRSPISPTPRASPASPTSKKAVDRSPAANKLVEQIIRTPGREPSPQPTHFSLPYGNGNGHNPHRVLRSATVGYIAPTFVGKADQMEEGKSTTLISKDENVFSYLLVCSSSCMDLCSTSLFNTHLASGQKLTSS
jgi:hypothetical protein